MASQFSAYPDDTLEQAGGSINHIGMGTNNNNKTFLGEIYTKLNYQPSELGQEDLENPQAVMEEFFDNMPVHDARAYLWKLYKAAMHHIMNDEDGHAALEILHFYSQMTRFINAAYLVCETSKIERLKDLR